MDTPGLEPFTTSDAWSDTLSALADPSLASLFWRAERLGSPSAWWQHVPFAHWIVCATAPRVLVELGTHTGVSYTAFCQAVARRQLFTRCHAVDTWHGDPQAGEYGEEIYEDLRRFHDKRFGTFSTLLRCTFDEALDRIEDAVIDLLHIDGLHTYDAVRHDFESWLPKLSDRAVVLFHDTNVRAGDFGVWRLWNELSGLHPSFEFLHGHGLGVLAIGKQVPAAVAALCGLGDSATATVRTRFARLGERWLYDTRERLVVQDFGPRLAAVSGEADHLRAEVAQQADEIDAARVAAVRAEEAASQATARASHVEAARASADARAAQAADDLVRANARIEEVEARRQRDGEILRSEAAQRLAAAQRDVLAALARAEQAEATAAEANTRKDRAEADIVPALTRAERAEANLSRALARAEQAEANLGRALVRVGQAEAAVALASGHATRVEASLVQLAAERDQLAVEHDQVRVERDQLLSSAVWRATWPVRSLGGRVPGGLRRAARGSAKLGWWTLTMKLPRKLRERQEMLRAYRVAADTPGPDLAALVQLPAEPLPPPLSATAAALGARSQLDMRDTGASSLVYVSGEPDTPGHLYRVVRPAAAAASLGARTSWMRVEEILVRLGEIETADVLVIWRAPWDERIAAAVDAARRGGAKVVFDVDDLMIVPELAKLDTIDGIRTQNLTEEMVRDHYARMRGTLAAADLCVGTTEELAQWMREAIKPAFVLPNGVDHATISASSLAARRRRAAGARDGLFRIGYAGGSRTHQRDFALCADAVAFVLRARPECRLVVFRSADRKFPVLDIEEFPALRGLEEQIEWRDFVPLDQLPNEMARFDVNLAPLEVGNPFCEAKSELKLFEAALVDVPTIASPTGPFRRVVRHGETGFLAATPGEWQAALTRLVDDAVLSRQVAKKARREALWRFGPERRTELMASLLDLVQSGRPAARAFELGIHCRDARLTEPPLSDYEIAFESDRLRVAEVTIVIPLYNYANHVEEALDSVRAQTLGVLDLVVVEDCSTDASFEVALRWVKANTARFNRLLLLRNRANSGLARTRNTGFDAAETPYVLALDADNRLLPECAAACLRTARETGAAFAYPTIQKFGASQDLMGTWDYDPQRLLSGNYIDAMALISKAAWVAAGGYNRGRGGWEDFAFWCRLMERGLWGERVPGGPLAEYRVHSSSMIQVAASKPKVIRRMMDDVTAAHPWLRLVWPLPEPEQVNTAPTLPASASLPAEAGAKLARILPLLRCPETRQPLALAPGGNALLSEDGSRRWPLVLGRPVLFPGMEAPRINDDAHLSNPLPASALALIHSTTGPVLHLSAGGSAERFDHVIEAEAAVFRHTDLISDVHHLPFVDRVFDAVIALNAFEHYRDPRAAAHEILRVLRPGGRVLIRTAFMQPLHEAPWHFYNCTRYGLEAWFEDFETEKLHVSENFHPGYSISWLASELELALRDRLSDAEADAFLATSLRSIVSFWRTPEAAKSNEPLWESLAALPQDAQDVTAAGFEFLGRRPAG
jgi:glycosyltransferase involved in cell wall biosynthesis/SAM-dependent methyltransferase